jgi:hypothetical protein
VGRKGLQPGEGEVEGCENLREGRRSGEMSKHLAERWIPCK